MSFLKNGTAYKCSAGPVKGRRGHKTGPGRGRHHGESMEDRPKYLTNPATLEAQNRDDRKVDEHPMSHRLKRRQLRHLRGRYKNAVGPEFNKVMASMHPGKHRVGKVRSM